MFPKWLRTLAVIQPIFVLLFTSQASPQTPSPELLVLEKGDRLLAIVDPATLKIVGRVAAGEDPHEVVANENGTRAYISNYGGFGTPHKTLSVVDLVSQKPLPVVDLGPLKAPHGVDIVKDKVYFTAEGSKVIGSYDPIKNEVVWVLGTGQDRTHMLKVKSDLTAIYTANITSGTVSIFEPSKNADASGWAETNVQVGKNPEGFDISPDGKELWAASHEEMVTIIDLATKKAVQTIDLQTKFANRLKFTPDGERVLISDLGTGDLIVVNAASRKEIKRISLGHGCAGILIVPDGSVAYVAVSRDDNVAVIDLKTLSVTGRITTGKGPDGLAWAVRK
jgi:YVTN family beta-propeller protein